MDRSFDLDATYDGGARCDHVYVFTELLRSC